MVSRFLLGITGALSLLACVSSERTRTVEARIVWPREVQKAAKIKLSLNLEAGKKIYGWPRADGQFTLHNVPEGTWLLDVIAPGLVFPQYRVDVGGEYPSGAMFSIAAEPEKLIQPPIILKPMAMAEYYEKREPFNLMSFIKTPYGLMIVFAIFAMVVLPRLKVDPEELREAREALTGGGGARSESEDRTVRARS